MINKLYSMARISVKKRNGSFPKQYHKSSYIHASCNFVEAKKLTIGKYVYIGSDCFINCKGGLDIQDGAAISSFVSILTEDHKFRNVESVPYSKEMNYMPVVIEKAAWIGLHAIILPGVRIGEGSIVGAGSVVTKDISAGNIVAGNPAKIIGSRDDDNWRDLVNNESYSMEHK